MKSRILLLAAITFLWLAGISNASAQKGKNEQIAIKTSAQCGMCKERIEGEIRMHKGVKEAILDIKTQELTITYNPIKTTADELKEAITEIGYDADEFPASEDAYDELPGCCKKPDDAGREEMIDEKTVEPK